MSEDHVYREEQEVADAQEAVRLNNAFVVNANNNIAAMRQEIASIKRETTRLANEGRGLSAQTLNAFTNTFGAMMDNTAATVALGMANAGGDFKNRLQSLRTRMESTDTRLTAADRDVNALAQMFSDVFTAINNENTSRKVRAEQIIIRMEQMLRDAKQLHPERFSGEAANYNTLANQLQGAKDSVSAGDYSAALVVTQSSIYNTSAFLVRMGLLAEQYANRLEQARLANADLTERIACLKEPGGHLNYTMGGQQYTEEYSIEYWNGEKFGSICRRHEEVTRQLKDPALTADRLAALEAELQSLEADLTACDFEARERMVAADSVWNTAEQIYNVLEEGGWEAAENGCGYVNDDEREPVEIVMTRGRDTVSVLVTDDPATKQPSFVMDIHTKNPGLASMEKQRIYNQLMGEGMNIADIKHGNTCHAPEVFRQNTLENIKQRRRKQ